MAVKLLIFGITGDLSQRKLLPALKKVIRTSEFSNLEIIGISRRHVEVKDVCGGDEEIARRLKMMRLEDADINHYHQLKAEVDLKPKDHLLAYFAVPPGAATQMVDMMGEVGLNSPNIKILFEKPFGMDFKSAEEFIARTARYFKEEQLYRIDHYLAKEMTQNIVAIRGRNALFSNIWNNNFIESIDIIASESIGIEDRTGFYEQTGALRDFVQGHLMQLLALTLMDIPADFNWAQLPELRHKAIKQLKSADPKKAFRAQYDGYKDEVGNPDSQTETFVSLQLESNQPRWLDVPIRLVTGKALPEKTSEIQIHLKKLQEAQSNTIILKIQPDEGVDIEMFVKKPGYEHDFETRHLKLSYPADVNFSGAYERVIVDAIRSRKSLFARSDEILESWRVLNPIQKAWNSDVSSLPIYPKGSWPNDPNFA